MEMAGVIAVDGLHSTRFLIRLEKNNSQLERESAATGRAARFS